MNVLIDDGLASLTHMTGVGHHGHNVFEHLRQYCNCDITNYWPLKYVPRGVRRFTYVGLTNFHSFYKKYDIIHYQNHNTPLLSGKARKVVTIHDLGVFRFPETIPTFYVKYNQLTIKNSIRRADAIITPSKFTKQEIISLFPEANEEKIYPVDAGLRDIFFDKNIVSDILQRNNVEPYSYYFFLGSLSKRKNLKFLLDAFIKAKLEKRLDEKVQLLLGGQKWWGASEIKNLLDPKLGVRTLGYLKDADIVTLYDNSRAVVFPSLYEGFGSPVIEAMSRNAPLIVSNIPTSLDLNKRHNNQMYVFELGNLESLIEKLVLTNRSLAELRSGLNYGDISIYNYDHVAKMHYDVYRDIL